MILVTGVIAIAPDFLRYAGPLVGELPETALIGSGS